MLLLKYRGQALEVECRANDGLHDRLTAAESHADQLDAVIGLAGSQYGPVR